MAEPKNLEKGDLILRCAGIVKRFPGSLALDHVDLEIRRGEVHALVGQNGAGKSTLVKVITGVYACDEGEIYIDGGLAKLANPRDAEQAGLSIIHQDQQLVPQFDVKRNVFLGRELTKGGFLDFRAMQAQTDAVLKRIDADFSSHDLICNLSVGQREQVAIAAALLKQPKILILDEPTASLSRKEADKLFEIIRSLREQGVTIIYISHHFDEIFEVSDRITVLRDGKKAATLDVDACSKSEVIRVMIGREVSQLYPKKELEKGGVILRAENLCFEDRVNGVSFELHRGEILGIAGILGSGANELAMNLFGVNKITGGQIFLDNQAVQIRSPQMAKKMGIALIPEDRRNEGAAGTMSVKENLSLAFAKLLSVKGWIKKTRERQVSAGITERLRIKCAGMDQFVNTLSGGNQQKAVIGKWLVGKQNVFIMNQPTTGVDVGSKIEIYKSMTDLAAEGAGIIMISQDFEELLGMCDRILVIANGRITKTFNYGEATEHTLLAYATVIS